MKYLIPLLGFLFFLSCSSFGQSTVGLKQYEPNLSYEGLTLFDPISDANIYLIDNCGKLVHSWSSDHRPRLSTYLLENGHLLRATRGGDSNAAFDMSNGGGLVEILDWDSNVMWSYVFSNDTLLQHHDIEPMPNGNILVLAWDRMTNEEAIQTGRNPALLPDDELWPDMIIEVRPIDADSMELVWTWRFKDHLIQDFDASKDNFGVVADHPELIDINYVNNDGAADWIHGNSIAYNEERDEIVISSRKTSEIYIIDHSTTTAEAAAHSGGNKGKGGDFLYRWGNPQVYGHGAEQDRKLFGQHDAHWIPSGYPDEDRIIVFNNGRNRTPFEFTTVDIIETPLDGNDAYEYAGNAFGPETTSWSYEEVGVDTLFASFISGAHQLPNGNVLFCDGPAGTIHEVTQNGEKAWEYVIPINSNGPILQGEQPAGNNSFRARRYSMDYPGLVGDLTAGEPIELNPTPDDCMVEYLGLSENDQENILVYPNPANGVFNVSGISSDATIELLDAVGRSVILFKGKTDRMDVSSLTAGIYHLLITDKTKVMWSKLTIVH